MHYSDKVYPRGKTKHISQYTLRLSKTPGLLLLVLREGFSPPRASISLWHYQNIQPASTNLGLRPVFFFFSAVARAPEALKALISDSRRKWICGWQKNGILDYVRGQDEAESCRGEEIRYVCFYMFMFALSVMSRSRDVMVLLFAFRTLHCVCLWGKLWFIIMREDALGNVFIHLLIVIWIKSSIFQGNYYLLDVT